MKKIKGMLLVGLLCICSGCGSKEELSYIENNCLSDNFEVTLKDAYVQNNEVSSIQLVSLENETAPIKMLALQNLYQLQEVDVSNYNEKNNEYKFAIEKSIYEKKNYVPVEKLTNQSAEEDFFEAYYVSELLKDEALKSEISQKYSIYPGSTYDILSEEIFQFLNSQYAGKEDPAEKENVQKKVYGYIDQTMKEDMIDVAPESLSNLFASLAYLVNNQDVSKNQQIQQLYGDFITEYNEKKMIFDVDICTAYYARCISCMRELLNQQNEKDFFYEQALAGKELYMGVTYDITSPKNFAMYVVGLCFGEEIEKTQYDTLKNIFTQIENATNPNDYMAIYYLRLAAERMNIEFKMGNVPAVENETSYYYMLLSNTKRNFDDLYQEDGGIEALLYACDCSLESSRKTKLLKNISIFEYENEIEFPMLLNLYVVNMKENNLLDEKTANAIKEYIGNRECDYGYARSGQAYDFRTSVYYTNILYLLDGGMDYGLR